MGASKTIKNRYCFFKEISDMMLHWIICVCVCVFFFIYRNDVI